MSDIRQLENRIKNLEYYTSLSLLETNTANLFVPDSNGLNRFKSGFFVDNFTSTLAQENDVEIKNSIDPVYKELRPKHYTNSIDLIPGPVENIDPTEDLAFSSIEGINVRKTGDIITLDYAEVEWLKQSFATRSESVTPFLISFWQGTLELTPASDTWVDTVRLEAKIINAEGNYAESLATAARTLNVDPQTGFAPTVWNSWVQNWTGQEIVNTTRTRTETSRSVRGVGGWANGGSGGPAAWVETTTDTTALENLRRGREKLAAMKKAGVVLFALLALIGVSVLAADTLITGYDTTTGVGTFKVVSDGTHSTLTVDKIVASNATGLTNVTAATALTMQRQTVASVTNVVLTLQRGDVVYGDVTNSLLTNVVITVQSAPVAAVTNATAATTLTVEF
jgi:hypothetical protein